MISPEQIDTLLAAVVTIIMTLIAVWQNRSKVAAQVVANASQAEARAVGTQLSALTPGTPEASDPVIVSALPERSWKMSDATKRWLTFDATDAAEKEYILKQVADAEAQYLTNYRVYFLPAGSGYAEIEYGLYKGGSGNPHSN